MKTYQIDGAPGARADAGRPAVRGARPRPGPLLAAAVAAILLFHPSAGIADTLTGNLLVNPDAESAIANGWTVHPPENGFDRCGGGACPATVHGGAYSFWGGPFGPVGPWTNELRQLIDVSAYAAGIDQGNASCALAGWAWSRKEGPFLDTATITVEFLTGAETSLGVFTTGAINPPQLWVPVSAEPGVPAATRRLRVRLIATRTVGNTTDALFDDLSIQLRIPDPPLTGACCVNPEGCAELTAAQCAARNGYFHGTDVHCWSSPQACAPFPCCTTDGCIYALPGECRGYGDWPLPPGLSCSDCPLRPGACCFPDGHCEQRDPPSCASAGGQWSSGSCYPNPCPGGDVFACCFPDRPCSEMNIYRCADLGGTWKGGYTCSFAPCTLGACCSPDGTCNMTRHEECRNPGYSWMEGETCQTAPCSNGACCLPDGTCEILSGDVCYGRGGVFHRGEPCNGPTDLCGGACCLPDGTCMQTTEQDCRNRGGFFGAGRRCNTVNCRLGACCQTTGLCGIIDKAACDAWPGTWKGPFAACDPWPGLPCTAPPVSTVKSSWGAIKARYR